MMKSFTKRIRITKNGKLVRRKMAQDHFRAKRTGKQTRDKRKGLSLGAGDAKVFRNVFHRPNIFH